MSAMTAEAATRTMQFAGMAGAEFNVGDVSNHSKVGFCEITIVNTGKETQNVTRVDILSYSSASQTTGGTTWSGPDFDLLRTSSAADASKTCTGNDLPEGGFCFFRFALDTLPSDGRYTICAGRIVIADKDPSKPGSVTAAGSVTMRQEVQVLGGQLSGAYYASGSHIQNSANLAVATDGSGAPDPSNSPLNADWSHNPNYYCVTACSMAGGADDLCRGRCGIVSSGSTGEPYPGSGMVPLFTSAAPSGYPDTTEPPASVSVSGGNGGSSGHGGYMMRVANTHWAGGMVYEMNVGPMTSICSGNHSFFVQGGNDFVHADGVDGHAIIKGSNSSYPPERILCAHRHAMDDLYMQAGSVTPIVINGGQAF
jgi:hypothetical protein